MNNNQLVQLILTTPIQATAAGFSWRTTRRHYHVNKIVLEIGTWWSPACVEPLLPMLREAGLLRNLTIVYPEVFSHVGEPGRIACMVLEAASANLAIETLCLYCMAYQGVGTILGQWLGRTTTRIRSLRLVDVSFLVPADNLAMANGLEQNFSLRSIEFSTWTVQERPLYDLHSLLPACRNLESFSVDGLLWTPRCGPIVVSVASQSSWRELHLTSCAPQEPEQFRSLLAALDRNIVLRTFKLCSGPIASPVDLRRWLSTHRDLRSLELSRNLLDANGFRTILDGIQQNQSIIHLKLEDVFSTQVHSDALRNLLTHNGSIQELDLSDCEASGRWWGEIFSGFHNNSTVQGLDLSRVNLIGHVGIPPLGVRSIAEAVRVSALSTLRLQDVELDRRSMNALIRAGLHRRDNDPGCWTLPPPPRPVSPGME